MATKNITVKHFKEYLKPALTQRPIYIRRDLIESSDDISDKDVAIKVAQMLPLIRVGDYVVHRSDISYFSIEVGQSLFPKITFTFNDEYFKCRSKLTSKLDFITVYVGNINDEYFIKQEYVLNDVYANPGSPDITLSGFLYIPRLYDVKTRYFNIDNDADTSWKVIKKLCEECQLGLISNIENTKDSQTWIQDSVPTFTFLNDVITHSYNGNDTKLVIFIDQYDYLNIVDIKRAYENRELEKTAKYPQLGNPIGEQKEVKLTSSRYESENYPFQITSWTNKTSYGSNIDKLSDTVTRFEYDMTQLPFAINQSDLKTNTRLIQNLNYTAFINDNVHINYKNVKTERTYVDRHYSQGDTISIEMAYPIMLLYPYMYVPVELFYETFRPEHDDANKPKDVYELGAEIPTIEKEAETKDEIHSGDYIITSINYEISQDGNNTQSIELQRLPLIKTT